MGFLCRFNPDRFSEETLVNPYAFKPFGGAGGRVCPAYRLANMEVVVYIAIILLKFKVNLVPGQEINRKHGIITKATDEIWITLEKRQRLDAAAKA